MAKTATSDAQPDIPPTGRAPLFKRVSSETVIVNAKDARKLAENHRTLPQGAFERDLDAGHVKELVDRIRHGWMIPFNWATVAYKGTKYRENGQHSSHAIIEAGDALPDEVVIHLDHYEAPDATAMGLLFRQFDARICSRSKRDVSGAYQGLVPELAGCNRKWVKLGIEGAAWFERYVQKSQVLPSGDDLYRLLFAPTYHKFLNWINHVLSSKTGEMAKAPVIGAMYGSFVASESQAQEFWSHVAKDDVGVDDDPRTVLSRTLLQIKEGQIDPRPAAGELYMLCAQAWKLFLKGDKTRTLRVNPKKGLDDIAA